MGLSFLVGEGVEALEVLVRWGDYHRVEAEGGDQNRDGAVPDGETEAGRDRQQTTGESGEGAGGEAPGEKTGGTAPGEEVRGEGIRSEDDGKGTRGEDPGDDEAAAGVDEASRNPVRSWWQRTPRTEPVR